MRKASLRILTLLICAALIMAGIEIALRLAGVAGVQAAEESMFVLDPQVNVRPNPEYYDHDSNGWRNTVALQDVDVIALGDSQTYGIGAWAEDAWPAQLQRLTGKTVYQMAFGGYGIAHLLTLMPEALSHDPEIIIVGVYLGANFTSANDFVYHGPHAAGVGWLRTKNPHVRKNIGVARRIDGNGWERLRFLDCQRPQPTTSDVLLSPTNIMGLPELGPIVEASRNLVPTTFAPWSVLATVMQRRIFVARTAQMQPPPICIRYQNPDLQTILTPAYRLVALESTDPRIVEGERITIDALIRMDQMAKSAGAVLVALLIPTKESAFRSILEQDLPSGSQHLQRLWQQEEKARERLTLALDAEGVAVVDALPNLSGLIHNGEDPYLGADANGHPSWVGYRAIAQSIVEQIGILDAAEAH